MRYLIEDKYYMNWRYWVTGLWLAWGLTLFFRNEYLLFVLGCIMAIVYGLGALLLTFYINRNDLVIKG